MKDLDGFDVTNKWDMFRLYMRGTGFAIFAFWSLLSFAPLAGLATGESANSALVNWLFVLTSFFGVATLYLIGLFLAPLENRRMVSDAFVRMAPSIGAYAVIWIVLYAFSGWG